MTGMSFKIIKVNNLSYNYLWLNNTVKYLYTKKCIYYLLLDHLWITLILNIYIVLGLIKKELLIISAECSGLQLKFEKKFS